MKDLKMLLSPKAKEAIKKLYAIIGVLPPFPLLLNSISKIRYKKRKVRMLEIGPGPNRIAGFETLNVVPTPVVDYVADAAQKLPFNNDVFDLVYASHILEHIPWFQASRVLKEWRRVLKPGGWIEIWVPDALRICSTLVRYEQDGVDETHQDGWYKFNSRRDPCIWAAGRLYTYGDGSGKINHPNWHRSLFTPRYLMQLLCDVGFEEVGSMDRSEVRGHDHGWINLGVKGKKPLLN